MASKTRQIGSPRPLRRFPVPLLLTPHLPDASGCQWDQLPERFGPKSTVHDWFQRWVAGGHLREDLGGAGRRVRRTRRGAVAVADRPTRCWARPGSGGKKTGKNPTDRGKKGTKKSLLTDGDGGPLGVVIAGANVVEQKLLEGDDRGDRGRAARPGGGGAEPVPGQGVRQPQRS